MAGQRKIKIPNPKLSANELTYLDDDYSTGTDLTVLSNLGFAAQDILVAGQVGDEQTEQKDISSVTDATTITISAALNFPHTKQTPIYKTPYNQVSVESQYGSSGAWTVLVTQDIQWDKLETLYIDPNGADQYNYRFRFYNSITGNYSAYSPTISGAGFANNTVGRMIINTRRKVRDPNREKVSDERIIELLVEGQDTIAGVRADWWFLRVDTYELVKRGLATGIPTVANQSYYDLEDLENFNYLKRIRYNFSSNTNQGPYDLTAKPDEEFDRFEQSPSLQNNNNVLYYKVSPPDTGSNLGYYVVWPVPMDTGGTFYPIYFKTMNRLNDISDTTSVPYPQILEDYAAWRLHNDLGNTVEAGKYKNLFFGNTARGTANEQITGIALLTMNHNNKTIPSNKPQRLWKYSGRRANKNSFSEGLNNDTIKENYM